MQISSVGRTSFGLRFDSGMYYRPIYTTKESLTKYQPDKVTEWEDKLKKLRSILPDDYSIYHVDRGSSIYNLCDIGGKQIIKKIPVSEIYLKRTTTKSNEDGVFLTSIQDNFMGKEEITYIINQIRKLQQGNNLPK